MKVLAKNLRPGQRIVLWDTYTGATTVHVVSRTKTYEGTSREVEIHWRADGPDGNPRETVGEDQPFVVCPEDW